MKRIRICGGYSLIKFEQTSATPYALLYKGKYSDPFGAANASDLLVLPDEKFIEYAADYFG